MAISDDLFLAILSMDAYNRGYNPGLQITGSQIGDAFLGRATDPQLEPEAVAASFFAQAYTWNGQTVISYRGTDNPVLDPIYGWPVGGGNYTVDQAEMAAKFYQTVVQGNNSSLELADLYSANVTLTGHSLGGGLAGLVASIYDQTGRIYDPMAFTGAATSLYNAGRFVGSYDEFGNYIIAPGDPEASAKFSLYEDPGAIVTSTIKSYRVDGETLSTDPIFCSNWLGASSSYLAQSPFDLNFQGILDSVQPVGWVERQRNPSLLRSAILPAHDKLPAQLRFRRQFLFHRQPGGTAVAFAHRTRRQAARGVSRHQDSPPVYRRSHCHPPRPSPCDLGLAGS